MTPTDNSTPRGPRWWGPRAFCAVVIVFQLYFIWRGYEDPHKHFAYQPFNESDSFAADVFRVTRFGTRIPASKPWHGYKWSDLVRARGIDAHVPRFRHASSGAPSILYFTQEALDYVADHTPADKETAYYEARIVYKINGGPEKRVVLKSKLRFPVARPAKPL